MHVCVFGVRRGKNKMGDLKVVLFALNVSQVVLNRKVYLATRRAMRLLRDLLWDGPAQLFLSYPTAS